MDGWMDGSVDGCGWCQSLRGVTPGSKTPACTTATHPSAHPPMYPSIYRNLKQALLHAARLVDLRASRQRGERGSPHHLSKAAGAA